MNENKITFLISICKHKFDLITFTYTIITIKNFIKRSPLHCAIIGKLFSVRNVTDFSVCSR